MNGFLPSVVLAAFLVPAVLADEKPAEMKSDKPVAQTKATPKARKDAPAKAAAKAADAAKKAPGFKAYEAGPWKPVNRRKGKLYGRYALTDGDLVHQPVLIVKFDPAEEIDGEKRETDPRYIYNFTGWEVKVQPRLQVVNVPSRPLTKDELATLSKKAGATAAVAGFPWYEDIGLEKEPENATGKYPFYYVVSADGKVVYAGDKGKQAQGAVYSALRQAGTPDAMLGFVKPEIHAKLCEGLALGTDVTKTVAKLRPLAAKGEEASRTEAQAILDALDQTKTYLLKTVLAQIGSEPQEAFILAQQTGKTFPRAKADFQSAVASLSNNPVVKQSLKVFQTLMEAHQKLQAAAEGKGPAMKKPEINKAYQQALVGERMCAKARKEFGDRLPRAFMTLENMVQVVKAELEAAGAGAK